MVSELYTKLRALNIRIDVVNGRLDMQAPKGVLQGDLLEQIKQNKSQLIDWIELYKQQKQTAAAIPLLSEKESYALSANQKRMWILNQFDELSAANNIYGDHLFEGDLKPEVLGKALNRLIERHEILRTIFKENEQGEVRQWVKAFDAFQFHVECLDLQSMPENENLARKAIQEVISHVFDLRKGPLLKVKLIRLSPTKYVFVYVMHHIISDGRSMEILINELKVLYHACSEGLPDPLEPLRIQYKDYAAWQTGQFTSDSSSEQGKYWLNQFAGELPVLDLPSDFKRPALRSYKGGVVQETLDTGLSSRLKLLCQKHGCTLFHGSLALVNILLYRYSGTEDISIGCPIVGRDDADLVNQIGFYVNTLALRTRFSGSDSFLELLDKVKGVTLKAYEHQAYPFDTLIEQLHLKRDLSRNALFDVMLAFQSASEEEDELKLDELAVKDFSDELSPTSKFDLTFQFDERGDSLQLAIEYSSDLFERSTVVRLFNHFIQIAEQALIHPTQTIQTLSYVSQKEQDEILVDFNKTAVDYPEDQTVVGLFEAQAFKTPDRIALAFEGKQISYQDLNEKSNRFAHYLRGKYKIKPDDLICLTLARSEQLIIAILAVLKSGGAYVPLDIELPQERRDHMIADCQSKVVINSIEYDGFLKEESDFSKANLPAVNNPMDLAYVMYTSGSTGKPKGVMVPHKGIVRLVKSTNFFVPSGKEVLLSTGAVSFDATTFEYWSMLLNGGQLVMCSKDVLADVNLLITELKAKKTDTIFFTTGWFHQLVDNNIDLFEGIKTVVIGGDKLSASHCNSLRLKFPNIKIVNGYGPTENTTFSTTYSVESSLENVPLGRPINNSTAYICDNTMQLTPVGVIGEICLGGAGLARGYLNQAELSALKFVPNPFKTGEWMYKTGDLGRWLADGNIEFAGRLDDQVKIRGYRVELGEIEKTLQAHPNIKSSVVLAKPSPDGEKELIAYIVADEILNASTIRVYMSNTLPGYMIPDHFVQLDAFPLSETGKVNKKGLPDTKGVYMSTAMEYLAPRNETELMLLDIWSDILGMDKTKIGVRDNFFEIGGHSLKAILLIHKIEKLLKIKLIISDVFSGPTIESLSELILAKQWLNESADLKFEKRNIIEL
jgi:tyrocidine synthetase-3